MKEIKGNRERGTENGEWDTGNGEQAGKYEVLKGTGNGESGMGTRTEV